MTASEAGDLKATPLRSLHLDLGAKMIPFAGYVMPVHYGGGIVAEHHHTRLAASLFDVSHMGQAFLRGGNPAIDLETLVPGDIEGLAAGHTRYTQLTNEAGGILDDLMVTNFGDHLFLVVNAACKDADFAHIRSRLGPASDLEELAGRALIALQGPQAESVLGRSAPGVRAMSFMTVLTAEIGGISCMISRSGYTGEDGFEISVSAADAPGLARALLGEPEVAPAGLGARDTLRLEAGLCLYGHDIDETTTPVEAGLAWSIGKRRRAQGGYPGAAVIGRQIVDGAPRKRIGLRPEGRAPVRDGAEIADAGGEVIGMVTSGGFGPTLGGPIAMGYVGAEYLDDAPVFYATLRGKQVALEVCKLPFVEHRYHRG